MLFNVATGYALKALASMQDDGHYGMAKDFAGDLGLPAPFLAKILQNLVRAEILESVRGPKGGFRLARPAHRITVDEVVIALEGHGALQGCVMGFAACDANNPCPLHDAWSQVKTQVEASMTSMTLRDLQLTKLRRIEAHGPAAAKPAIKVRPKKKPR